MASHDTRTFTVIRNTTESTSIPFRGKGAPQGHLTLVRSDATPAGDSARKYQATRPRKKIRIALVNGKLQLVVE